MLKDHSFTHSGMKETNLSTAPDLPTKRSSEYGDDDNGSVPLRSKIM